MKPAGRARRGTSRPGSSRRGGSRRSRCGPSSQERGTEAASARRAAGSAVVATGAPASLGSDPSETSVGTRAGVEPAVDLEEPLSGQSGGAKYTIACRLGGGGMGEVYLASDRDLRRQVAVKTLQDAEDPRLLARFIEEAQVTAMGWL